MADLAALGCFDEEECRFFLREVGARVVPNYPFSYGMEEVHSLIVEEYGQDGVPDVTSLLHELLEEDNTSSGIGDDGDIWRSWRYHWRHRNVRPSLAPPLPAPDLEVGQCTRPFRGQNRNLPPRSTHASSSPSPQGRQLSSQASR
jgi:hypothetical protein